MSSESDSSTDSEQSTTQSLVSLALAAHLFFVALALTSNLAPSPLQLRLLQVFAPYTRTLNLDLNFTPYHLTHASADDVDHRIEVLPEGGDAANDADWILLPDAANSFHGSEGYQRYKRLAKVMSFFAENEEQSARLAQAIGRHFIDGRGITPKQIRCRKHMLQSRGDVGGGNSEQHDPNAPGYFQTTYAANLVMVGSNVQVVPIPDAAEAAQAVEESR